MIFSSRLTVAIKAKLKLGLAVMVSLFLSLAPLVGVRMAYATAGILDTRVIKMSSSANAQNNVKYSVSFNVGSTSNVGGIVIDFCAEDPIPSDTCTQPTSFNVNKNTVTVNNQVGITGLSVDTTNSTAKTLILTRSVSSISSATNVTFDLGDGTTTGILNPATTNVTFYARIFTFAATATAQAYSSTVPGTYVDFGGIALSTTAQINVTAKVQEQLSFCIYTNANCAAGGTAIALGDTNGISSASHSYTNISGKFQASTNAANGLRVFTAGNTLTSAQSNTIAAIGSTSAASSTGSEQYGFCLAMSGGSVTATSPYNDASCGTVTSGQDAAGSAKFAFDITSSPNLTSLGGMEVASSPSTTTTATGTIALLANIGLTTKAGIYTSTLTWIAVGTF